MLLAETPAGKTVALARLIVAGDAPCPALREASGKKIATRGAPQSAPFSVKVCEALYPFGRSLEIEGGGRLPAVAAAPARVAIFGDSGCKPNDQQGCTMDDPAWPFPRLAASAAKTSPELVIHVGDYNYRGTPSGFEKDGKKLYYYDAGDGAPVSENCGLNATYYSQNSPGNQDADTWQAWWLDFFEPAAPLLAAAPWVFARGNHELCSHAGPGFFYFLDGGSDLLPGGQHFCPPQDRKRAGAVAPRAAGPAGAAARRARAAAARLGQRLRPAARPRRRLPSPIHRGHPQAEKAAMPGWSATVRSGASTVPPTRSSAATARPARRRPCPSASSTRASNARSPARPARRSCRGSA